MSLSLPTMWKNSKTARFHADSITPDSILCTPEKPRQHLFVLKPFHISAGAVRSSMGSRSGCGFIHKNPGQSLELKT